MNIKNYLKFFNNKLLNQNSNIEIRIPKNFNSKVIEKYWNYIWEKNLYFYFKNKPRKNKKSYVIQSPPPNITGKLHMGHAFNQTIMDSLIRWRRMSSNNAIFIPGVDHAGIATQIAVEKKLKIYGINKKNIKKEDFIKKIWNWKKKYVKLINNQIKRIGSSVDWSRRYFTMDKNMSIGVFETFVKLYKKGLIYRGRKIVNWDTSSLTVVSDLEVINKLNNGYLWYITYNFEDGPNIIFNIKGSPYIKNGLTISTTRPETIFADSAICINPNDDRYFHLIGKMVFLPLSKRKIPIISDKLVDPLFGTGCVKISGAHDQKDYECSIKNDLNCENIFTKNAKINHKAPREFIDLNINDAKKKIIKKINLKGYLKIVRDYTLTQQCGDRTGSVLEPMLTEQWFINIKKNIITKISNSKQISEIALDLIRKKIIKFYPDYWKNTYKNWILNIHDWCISRQLWWGHQIPAWYHNKNIFVAISEKYAYRQAKLKYIFVKLNRDNDVLDTWFSSSLIPFNSLGWPKFTLDISSFFPSNIIVTGFDIIFFWIARMIIMSINLTNQIPFRKIYIHSLIKDNKGMKMSKSRGNIIDPIELIDGSDLKSMISKRIFNIADDKKIYEIKKNIINEFPYGIPSFGSDSLRITMSSYATLGSSINFNLERCQGYKNFCNKLWNSARYILINKFKLPNINICYKISFLDKWIINKLKYLIKNTNKNFKEYRFDIIIKNIYHFIWEDYCDWYMELSKVKLVIGNLIERISIRKTFIYILENILRILHPISPFITEELWQIISIISGKNNTKNKFISISRSLYPKNINLFYKNKVCIVSLIKQHISLVRSLKNKIFLNRKYLVSLFVVGNKNYIIEYYPYLLYLCDLFNIYIINKLPNMKSSSKLFNENFLTLHNKINVKNFKISLNKIQLKNKKILSNCYIRINNKNFLYKAPNEVVRKEFKKLKNSQKEINKYFI